MTSERPSRPRAALLFATSGHSGVDRVIANLLPEFARCEVDFDLLTLRGHGPAVTGLPANVRHWPLPARHRDTALLPLIRYLRGERPVALLTASHRLNRAALLARALARVPVRVAIRMGMSLREQAGVPASRHAGSLRSMRFWYRRADTVITPSAGVADDLRALAGVPADRLRVIANPIVTPRLAELAAAAVDDPWFAAGAPPVVLGAGSLEPRKDFATLIGAFARLRRERPCRLLILGEGPERAGLEGLAATLGVADDVRLPGHEPNPYRFMARAAAFALSSRREGSGAVLVEALACGTPVTATDCPSGPAEILQDGAAGPLVPVGDEAALAAALGRLLARPPGADALRAAAEPFRADLAAGRYLAALGLSPEHAA